MGHWLYTCMYVCVCVSQGLVLKECNMYFRPAGNQSCEWAVGVVVCVCVCVR